MSWAIWITGPPGSGKSALARAVEAELAGGGRRVKRLELDEIRKTITPEPTYSDQEREIVYRALGCLAVLLVEAGTPVLIDATAHRRLWRDLVRRALPRFAEVQLVCPLEVCRQRERVRAPGHAPRGIYDHAGRPGATVPGVDIPYERALAPEVLIDTSVQSLADAVGHVMGLVGRLERAVATDRSAAPASVEPGWAIWITGRPGSGKTTLAVCVAERLRALGEPVRVLDLARIQSLLLGDGPVPSRELDIAHRVLAYAAKLLTEAGVSVIVDATAPRRAWREAARALIPVFAEIQLLCAAEKCLERERAARWGLTSPHPPVGSGGPRPDIVLDYEESGRAELTIRTDVHDVRDAADRVLVVIRRLAGSLSRT
jgi:adenylylsulfate kinase